MRYRADITAGALKVPESRIIADLLLRRLDETGWKEALYDQNVLQTRSPKTAARLTLLLRGRLSWMDADLWKLVCDGAGTVATQACLAAAVKHSALLGDSLDLVVREQYTRYAKTLSNTVWDDYIHRYHEGTLSRMRTEYVIPLQGKIASRLDQLADDIAAASSNAHRKRLEKERETLRKQHMELQAFDEQLRHYADQRISLDLDDGVKVNYGKFGDLLTEVKAVTGGSMDES